MTSFLWRGKAILCLFKDNCTFLFSAMGSIKHLGCFGGFYLAYQNSVSGPPLNGPRILEVIHPP